MLQRRVVEVHQINVSGVLKSLPLGKVKVRHAGERLHPGSFFGSQAPGFRLELVLRVAEGPE